MGEFSLNLSIMWAAFFKITIFLLLLLYWDLLIEAFLGLINAALVHENPFTPVRFF